MAGIKVPCGVSWCCFDCVMILANGTGNPEWSETEAADHQRRMTERQGDAEITLGMLASEHSHESYARCGNVNWHEKLADPEDPYSWIPDGTGLGPALLGGECDCETLAFAWAACHLCGSNLGGSRHAFTFWVEPS